MRKILILLVEENFDYLFAAKEKLVDNIQNIVLKYVTMFRFVKKTLNKQCEPCSSLIMFYVRLFFMYPQHIPTVT